MKVVIISPSGALYGSEQVLLDFLNASRHQYDIGLCREGQLFELLGDRKRYKLLPFTNKYLPVFYIRFFFLLLLRRYSTVYWNEAGHSKYALLLARVFKKTNFIVHVRIIEDVSPSRWPIIPSKNLTLISISKFIQSALHFDSTLIYDPFFFSKSALKNRPLRDCLKIGVIGRITFSKGINKLVSLLNILTKRGLTDRYQFLLYGDISEDVRKEAEVLKNLQQAPNVKFQGFCNDKDKLYQSIDLVLHLNELEPLGRIYLEALDAQVPLIGFNTGGIGEIGKNVGLMEWLIPVEVGEPGLKILDALEQLRNDWPNVASKIHSARKRAAVVFSGADYIAKIENLLFK